MVQIEIDKDSGFCNGVVTAIRKAEEELDKSGHLYCLGDIVHNNNEVERLCAKGLRTITHSEFSKLHNVKVLLRAHGEPPETYRIANENKIEIIDATCPVVLQLQKRIKSAYSESSPTDNTLILIYGKNGHAEVNGLVGQTEGNAVVIQNINDLDDIDLSRDIVLYSQTTKSLEGFKRIVDEITHRKTTGKFQYFDTICRQVANRIPKIRQFATAHEVILFVCGKKSSNGKVLFNQCRSVNEHSYFISSAADINLDWFKNIKRIGICGATSTPSWLMSNLKQYLESELQLND